MYSYEEVLTYVNEEDVKFIRLAFFDIYGKQKNISIMPDELPRAFKDGISFDASAVAGFGDAVECDLFLHPEPSTLAVLPWRPSHGRVVRMYCNICHPDGTPCTADSRRFLKQAIADASDSGISVDFGPEMEFYLFETDEKGRPTDIPFDNAGYMDISPEDRGENVRREICFTLTDMGIHPEASHHEEGPGQNEIDFRYSDALSAADNTALFKWIVKATAMQSGLYADFSAKPIEDQAGNGMHINISLRKTDERNDDTYTDAFMSGILKHIEALTVFFNPTEDSYKRLGGYKAPRYITWSPENRSQTIRIPAVKSGTKRIELRTPDPSCNPYLAFALIIYAGLDGIKNQYPIPEPCNINLFTASSEITDSLQALPRTLTDAAEKARTSDFVRVHLPEAYIDAYCKY